ncbi:hypothetical protein Q0590_07265 [Rhodocytophaga aerolata]|uniref:Uncharacterized protein n=1 Tax=Rhodocytophaga aerolata TaxID=455078 RepID=A0ABT8R296_9BACT|nr:hypothetical protein [Rhodocytophaga aerolata]MDO1446044.1 hypothetical protein [Rhodocytophaga aerolata]
MKHLLTYLLCMVIFSVNAENKPKAVKTVHNPTSALPVIYSYIDMVLLLKHPMDVVDGKGNLKHTGFTYNAIKHSSPENIYKAKQGQIFKVIGVLKEQSDVYFLRLEVVNTDQIVYYRVMEGTDKLKKQFLIATFAESKGQL